MENLHSSMVLTKRIKYSIYSLILFTFIFVDSSAQEVNSQRKLAQVDANKIADNGLFTYQITGDMAKDIELYRSSKDNFIKNNPEKYKQWLEQSKSTEKIIVSKADFDKMPKDKQQQITSNPTQYQIK